ncbi:MAG: hypothetical protein JNK90_00795 [Planctomycetaceae bacterium]|nr:hypothetical protein [Planctomycetaceae bacterium]
MTPQRFAPCQFARDECEYQDWHDIPTYVDDPWQLTQDPLAEKIPLPRLSFKLPISDTLREIRTGNMRLPDPEGIE